MITIKINTDTSAFEGESYFFDEVARLLRKIADSYEKRKVRASYTDINGNRVVRIS
jgi:hypothetical protein